MEDGRKVLCGKYEVGKLLGKGTFAKVYHCRNLSTGESVAVKVINKAEVKKEKLTDQIKREINVMRLVRHPNIVEIREVMATKTHIFVVMEYVRGGELFAKVARGRLKEDAARRYFQQLVAAVDYCHSRGVSHRDLKPENLLLDDNGDLKVSDFGLSALPEQLGIDGLLHTQCGTPAYVAPEVLRKKGYDGATADIWSCGVILYVLLAGRLPFEDDNVMRMYAKVFKAEFEFPPWVSGESRRIISKLLVVDPRRRITMPAIMRCVWFNRGLDNTKEVPQEVKKAAEEMVSPVPFNAFDLISSMSPAGLDLSSMFEERGRREGAAFTTRRGAAEVVARIGEATTNRMRFEEEEEGGLRRVRLKGVKDGRKGRLVVTAEVREVVPDMMTVVRFSKLAGDTLEYCRFCEEVVKPSLKDVVWAWQGD